MLDELIAKIIAAKPDEDFALFYYPNGGVQFWSAEIVNPVDCVSLGESSGVYDGVGDSSIGACQSLLDKLRREAIQLALQG